VIRVETTGPLRLKDTGGNRLGPLAATGDHLRTIELVDEAHRCRLLIVGPARVPVAQTIEIYVNYVDSHDEPVGRAIKDPGLVLLFDDPETPLAAWVDKLIECDPSWAWLAGVVRAIRED
jgi:hypothetical protein